MSRVSELLNYLHETHTWVQVSEALGVPRSQVMRTARGTDTLPVGRNLILNNYFRREAYARLRQSGMSASSARRFSSYSVSRIQQESKKVNDVVEIIALSRVAEYAEYLKQIGQYSSWEDTMNKLRQSIAKSIAKSHKPIERLYEQEELVYRRFVQSQSGLWVFEDEEDYG